MTWPTVKVAKPKMTSLVGVGLVVVNAGDLPGVIVDLPPNSSPFSLLNEKPMIEENNASPQGGSNWVCPTVLGRENPRAVRIDCAGHLAGVHSSDR